MAEPRGPFVLAALLCSERERVAGAVNLYGVADRAEFIAEEGPGGELIPPQQYDGFLFVSLSAEGAVGPATFELRLVLPDGATAGRLTDHVEFAGFGDYTWYQNVSMRLRHTGTYVWEVVVDGRVLTRVPLTVYARPPGWAPPDLD